MYEANGFTGTPDIKFETGIGGEEGTDGARGTETGTIYLDIEKIKAAMTDKDTGGTGVLIGLIAHESSHSEKYGETTGNLLIEEGFADSKEELAKDKFKETDKTLSEEEKKEALAKIKDEVKDERAISDSLTISSKDEPVENNPALVLAAPTVIALTEKYGKVVADKLVSLYYIYGPIVLEAASTGGQKLIEYLSSNGGDSATGGNLDPNDPKWRDKLKFADDKKFEKHYQKHVINQKEFGNISKEEYLRKAQDFSKASDKNIYTRTATNGDILKFNKTTNEFLISTKDGVIRTYYKLSPTIHKYSSNLEYWNSRECNY